MVRGAAVYAGKVCLLAALYAVAAKTSFALAFVSTSIAPVWLPSGVAVAAVTRFGYRAVPGVWLGALVFNALTPVPLWVAALISVGNTLEAAAAGWLLRRAGFDSSMNRVRDVLALAGLGALVAPAISASIGVASLHAAGVVPPAAAASSWLLWWSGDAVGVLTLTPALLLAVSTWSARLWRRSLSWSRLAEAIALALVLPPIVWISLTARPVGPFIVFPVLVWAAIRFRRAGANLASLFISSVMVYAAAHGAGPFVAASLTDALVATQSFLAMVMATSLLLAAMTVEREHTTEALRHATAVLELRNAEVGRRNSELETERARLAEAQRVAHLGSWEWEAATAVVRWSDGMYQIFGLPLSVTPTYQGFLDRVHPDDRDRVDSTVQTARAAHNSFALEYRITRPDGSVRALDAQGIVVRDDTGTVVRMLGTGLDITERKHAQEALRAQQNQTQAIIDTTSDGFVSIDSLGRITGWNRSAHDLFGWTAEEAIGRRLDDTIIPPDLRQAHRAGLRRLAAGGAPRLLGKRIEVIACHRNGHPIPIELAIQRVESTGGQHFHAFLHDITERRQAEQNLAAARDQALEASRLKSQFLAMMSHEIRTPMNGVIGLARLLLDTDLSDDQRDHVDGIRGAGETLLAIINDILDFSKIEAGRMVIDEIDFDLDTALKQTIELLTEAARTKGLTLVATRQPSVPTALRGDPVRIRQILLNLVSNAVKFTEHGGVTVTARLDDPVEPADTSRTSGSTQSATAAVRPGSLQIRIDVVDTGIGISAAAVQHLFDPFVQADASTTREYGGTGLGLAICRRLTDAMGGRLEVSSRSGHGSTFSCVIPLTPTPAAVPAPAATATPLADGTAHRTGTEHLQLLLVEDNKLNQLVAVATLTRLGYHVDVAINGRQAIEMAQHTQYQAILMDCQMPEMDGYTTTTELRRNNGPNQHTPIIAMTAGAFDEDRERCLTAGMDDFITKPFDLDHLAATIARWTNRTNANPPGTVDLTVFPA